MSAWIQHVKEYSQEHNVPYKQALKEAGKTYKPTQNGGNIFRKARRGFKRAINKTGRYLKDIVNKRQGLPPSVRQTLEQYGSQTNTQITITRAPVSWLITTAMNMISLGSFNKKFNRLHYDKLFHLKMDMVLSNNVRVGLEKNIVIKLTVNPQNTDKTEHLPVNVPNGLTLQTLIDNTEKHMGSYKFTNYDVTNNTCQDFLMGVLNSNGMTGHEEWVKQNADALFDEDPVLAKVSHLLTNAVSSADVIINGSGLTRGVRLGSLKV